MRSLALLIGAALAVIASSSSSADNLESLKRKRSTLEEQLTSINAQIAQREQAAVVDVPSAPEKPSYFIKAFGLWNVNSAGGVEPHFTFINPNPSSAIKYIDAQITLYNSVGDVVASSIGNERTTGIQYTGPLSSSDPEERVVFEPVWYNTTGSCIKVQSLKVTFVNGKSQSFSGSTLSKAMAPDVRNECKLTKAR